MWANRDSKSIATSLTPYWITVSQNAVLLLESNVKPLRIAKPLDLRLEEYLQTLFMELKLTNEDQLMAYKNIQLYKVKVAKSYNKKLRSK